MQMTNLTPFQNKLIAMLLLRMMHGDPPTVTMQKSGETLNGRVIQAVAVSDAPTALEVALTYDFVRDLAAQFYPDVVALEAQFAEIERLRREGNSTALAQLDIL
jgi:hypothetical protein